ncbi:MAG: cupin domain-containing protein [Thaumarchaeota archaeon]|nr:cupin domain-containing protein [Nitrososphaerota archaeon]
MFELGALNSQFRTSDETLVRTAILDLNLAAEQNRWVIGIPPSVPEGSSFSSRVIQVNYQKRPTKEGLLKKEKRHSHPEPIEELYLVLRGTLEVEVEKERLTVGERQILCVPPDRCHRVVDLSDDAEFLVFRAPLSTDKTKKECPEISDGNRSPDVL